MNESAKLTGASCVVIFVHGWTSREKGLAGQLILFVQDWGINVGEGNPGEGTLDPTKAAMRIL